MRTARIAGGTAPNRGPPGCDNEHLHLTSPNIVFIGSPPRATTLRLGAGWALPIHRWAAPCLACEPVRGSSSMHASDKCIREA